MNKLTLLINAMAILFGSAVVVAVSKNFYLMLQAESNEKEMYKKKIKHCLIALIVVGFVAVGGNSAEKIMKKYFQPDIVAGSAKPELPIPGITAPPTLRPPGYPEDEPWPPTE